MCPLYYAWSTISICGTLTLWPKWCLVFPLLLLCLLLSIRMTYYPLSNNHYLASGIFQTKVAGPLTNFIQICVCTVQVFQPLAHSLGLLHYILLAHSVILIHYTLLGICPLYLHASLLFEPP